MTDVGIDVGAADIELDIEVDGRRHAVRVQPDGAAVTVDGARFDVRCRRDGTQAIVAAGDRVHVVDFSDARTAMVDGRRVAFRIHHLAGVAGAPRDHGATHGPVRPPMAGRIEGMAVKQGQEVAAGDVLFVLEAMKMRNEVKAPVAGRVARVHVETGATVDAGTPVLDLEPLEG